MIAYLLSPCVALGLSHIISVHAASSQVDLGLSLGTPFTCFHHHLMYMMEHLLPKSGEAQNRDRRKSTWGMSDVCARGAELIAVCVVDARNRKRNHSSGGV